MAPSLAERIASALPKDLRLTIHHCSALPTSTAPLFVAAPGAKPEATEVEHHFLSASVQTPDGLVQAFAIEVLAYTTETLTTLFVSKADSTGYLHLLNLAPGTPSPIRSVLVQFLIFLIESKKQAASRLVLSLFARAQDQYLFPGSIENEKKHVLDDRGLIKWWARIIDQIFSHYNRSADDVKPDNATIHHVRGHVVVPGIDAHEARTFIPRDADYKPSTFWQVSDPLKSLGMPDGVPERCLIPRFPDDPKARFAIDLDDELPQSQQPKEGEQAQTQTTPTSERWRSVRSLAQFWELMSFRQECSAGRLVGFLWGIWEPEGLVGKPFQATIDGQDRLSNVLSTAGEKRENGLPTPASSQQPVNNTSIPAPSPESKQEPSLPSISQQQAQEETSLPVPVAPSLQVSEPPAPQIQTPAQTQASQGSENVPPPIDAVKTHEVPPLVKTTPADVVLTADAYARSMELLLTLDYCDLPTAIESSKKLLSAIGEEGGKQSWGVEVVGTKAEEEKKKETSGTSEANSLAGLVRKRPKNEANTLSAGLVRKKPKT